MTAALDQLREHAESLGREVHDAGDLGIGVEFADGNDAFWLLHDPVVTTADPEADADEVIALFDRIDRLRSQVVHIARYQLAARYAKVARRRTGEWPYEMKYSSSAVDIGIPLTRLIQDCADSDVYEVHARWFKGLWLGKAPSKQTLDNYLNRPLPPSKERELLPEHFVDDDQADAEQPESILEAVELMNACRASDTDAERLTEHDRGEFVPPVGRIGQMLIALHARLPEHSAAVDLLNPSRLTIDFADGHDNWPIRTKDRRLVRRIKADGPETVAAEMADEFLRVERLRRRLLASLFAVASKRGMFLHQAANSTFFQMTPSSWLGRETREIGFNSKRYLTAVAKRYCRAPEKAARRWLHSEPDDFVQDVIDRLALTPDDVAPQALPEKGLPREAVSEISLPDLAPELVGQANTAADAAISAFWKDPDYLKFQDPAYFDPPDVWASLDDWVQSASKVGAERNPAALLIRHEAGDPHVDQLGPAMLQSFDPDGDITEEEAELAWIYRHSDIPKATNWFTNEAFEGLPYSDMRARLGDPLAQRYQRFAKQCDKYDIAVHRLPGDRRQPDCERLILWASVADSFAYADEAMMLAVKNGWTRAAHAFETNPHLLAWLLRAEMRSIGFDEPNALFAERFLLNWSRLDPSPFLARLILAIRATDLVALAEETGRRVAEGKPDVAAMLPSSSKIYRTWRKDLELPLAIAWTRCRAAGSV